MSYQLEGTLHKKFDTEEKKESFKSRDFVVKTEGEYPQFIKFQLAQDRCGIIDNIPEGSTVNVHFNLKGREHEGKYYTNANAWRIESKGGTVPVHSGANAEDEDSPF